MESKARKPNKGKAQTILKLGVQAQGKFCEQRGSLQREPTQGSVFQLQQNGALFQRLPQVQSREWGL
jgi:hypothetical protein